MLQSGDESSAFAPVKDRVLPEGLGQRIPRSLRDQVNSKIAAKSGAVSVPALSPIRRDARILRVSCSLALRNSGAQRRAQERVWPEGIECVTPYLFTLRWATVSRFQVHIRGLRRKRQSAALR